MRRSAFMKLSKNMLPQKQKAEQDAAIPTMVNLEDLGL